jgi:hypothetical protein
VTARDIITTTGLGENYVTRLLRVKLDADVNVEVAIVAEVDRGAG